MKPLFLFTIGLIFLLGIISGQVFISFDTGVSGIPSQTTIPELKSGGCLFMACCVVGGLGSKSEVLTARKWALSNKYINDHNRVEINKKLLAEKISQKYGTTFHSDFVFKKDVYGKGKTHFWVADSSGKEIFNAAGLGWHGK